jgi:hypothetical protein
LSIQKEKREKLFHAAISLMGDSGKEGIIHVEGVSMLPTFPADTRILVEFSCCKPNPGDILLYWQADGLVVHRFLAQVDSRKFGECFRTRGDGLSALDPPLYQDKILGRVTAFRRAGTWWGLDTGPARFWGRLVAVHNHFWAAAVVAGNQVDRVLVKLRLPRLAGPLARRLDTWKLRLWDRLLFPRFHTKIDVPDSSDVNIHVESSTDS